MENSVVGDARTIKFKIIFGLTAGAAAIVGVTDAKSTEEAGCPIGMSHIEVGAISDSSIVEFLLRRGRLVLLSVYSGEEMYGEHIRLLEGHNPEEGSIHLEACIDHRRLFSSHAGIELLQVELNDLNSDLGVSVQSQTLEHKNILSYSSNHSVRQGPWRPPVIFDEGAFIVSSGIPLLDPANSGEIYAVKVPGTVYLKNADVNGNGDRCVRPEFKRNGLFYDIATLSLSDDGRDMTVSIRAEAKYVLEKNQSGRTTLERMPTDETICIVTPKNDDLDNLTISGPAELDLAPSRSVLDLKDYWSCKDQDGMGQDVSGNAHPGQDLQGVLSLQTPDWYFEDPLTGDDLNSYPVLGKGEFGGQDVDGLEVISPLQAWYGQAPVNVPNAPVAEDYLTVACSNGEKEVTREIKVVMDCPPGSSPTIMKDGSRNCQ